MSTLTPCPACARHVRERTCPFCGGDVPAPAVRPRFVGPVTRAAVFSAVTGAAVAGCWTGPTAGPATTTTTETTTETKTEATETKTETKIDAPATGEIDGTVTDAQTGQPVGGAQVRLDNRLVTTTDYYGRYKFPGVAAGTHTINVATSGNRNHGGGATATSTIEVHGSLARADIQISLPPPAFDPNSIPKPYGAPPARRRVV